MKLLYGTGNPAKAAAMQNRIAGLGIELISLQDLRAQGVEIPNVPETGNTPLENARQKAHAYYEAFRMPVFSCDRDRRQNHNNYHYCNNDLLFHISYLLFLNLL